jgi:hypothetical protein
LGPVAEAALRLRPLGRDGSSYRRRPSKRAYGSQGYDVETCPECGGVMRVERFVLDPVEIARALDGEPSTEASRAREAHPPRGPPVPEQLSFRFEDETRAERRRFTKKA